MMRALLLAATLVFAQAAVAALPQDYYEVKKVSVRDVTKKYPVHMNDQVAPWDNGSCAPSNTPLNFTFTNAVRMNNGSDALASIDVMLDQIINMGKKVWSIVEAGKPVVNVKLNSAHALPKGLSCWSDLSGWKKPQSKVYNVAYENAYGMTMVDFTFRVTFTAGGNANGTGAYITNATMMVANLYVFWGLKFDATVEVPSVFNMGTNDNPIAGMQMNMNWKVDSPITYNEGSETFYISGQNKIEHLQ